ncbi:MAG: hypothetical protein WAM59_07305 [Candidatus Acidiferrales bacterium]
MLAGGIEFEHPLCDECFLRIYLDCVFELVVAIAEGWAAGISALFGFLAHALAHFLAQVLDVVPGDHHLNAMHELGL